MIAMRIINMEYHVILVEVFLCSHIIHNPLQQICFLTYFPLFHCVILRGFLEECRLVPFQQTLVRRKVRPWSVTRDSKKIFSSISILYWTTVSEVRVPPTEAMASTLSVCRSLQHHHTYLIGELIWIKKQILLGRGLSIALRCGWPLRLSQMWITRLCNFC